MDVGRVKLYLLDTNIPENDQQEHREITDQLYGGDILTRIRQEIVLGIGGLRTLHASNLKPTVWHMNEGHSAFLAIERMRLLIEEQKLSFDEAFEACRSNNVFTTHTSVPAGIDLFDPGLLYEYFGEYCRESGIPFDKFLALGRFRPGKSSGAVLHGDPGHQDLGVPQRCELPAPAGFAGNVAGAVAEAAGLGSAHHLGHQRRASSTWLNGDLAQLYDQYLQPDWRERYLRSEESGTWWRTFRIRSCGKRIAGESGNLVTFVRERVVSAAMARKASAAEQRRLSDVLEPDTFTIGFARRFATYKRATLLFRDVERLKRLLTNRSGRSRS